MIDIVFDITLADDAQDDPLFDTYELEMMLAHTKAQIEKQIQASLGNLRCEEHDQPPKVRVTGTFSRETEQLEVSYHIDTCCKPFLMQAIMTLNRS